MWGHFQRTLSLGCTRKIDSRWGHPVFRFVRGSVCARIGLCEDRLRPRVEKTEVDGRKWTELLFDSDLGLYSNVDEPSVYLFFFLFSPPPHFAHFLSRQ